MSLKTRFEVSLEKASLWIKCGSCSSESYRVSELEDPTETVEDKTLFNSTILNPPVLAPKPGDRWFYQSGEPTSSEINGSYRCVIRVRVGGGFTWSHRLPLWPAFLRLWHICNSITDGSWRCYLTNIIYHGLVYCENIYVFVWWQNDSDGAK